MCNCVCDNVECFYRSVSSIKKIGVFAREESLLDKRFKKHLIVQLHTLNDLHCHFSSGEQVLVKAKLELEQIFLCL